MLRLLFLAVQVALLCELVLIRQKVESLAADPEGPAGPEDDLEEPAVEPARCPLGCIVEPWQEECSKHGLPAT